MLVKGKMEVYYYFLPFESFLNDQVKSQQMAQWKISPQKWCPFWKLPLANVCVYVCQPQGTEPSSDRVSEAPAFPCAKMTGFSGGKKK